MNEPSEGFKQAVKLHDLMRRAMVLIKNYAAELENERGDFKTTLNMQHSLTNKGIFSEEDFWGSEIQQICQEYNYIGIASPETLRRQPDTKPV